MKCLEPAQLGKLALKNRLVYPPMVTSFADEAGFVTKRLIAYAVERVKGGIGLYILEATYVDKGGKGFGRGVGIDNDDKIDGLAKLTRAVHDHGGKISVQIHHGGRQCMAAVTEKMIVAPSDCPVAYSDEPVHVLNKAEIEEIVKKFAEGALRAKKAGFDAVEIHGAHGYLISQFLSPYTNKREDEYGGSLENRAKFGLDVIKAVRQAVGPEFTVTFRITVDEALPGGLTLQEGAAATAMFSKGGIDAVHVVAGNYASLSQIIPPACEGYTTNRHRAIAVREAVGPDFPLIVASRVKTAFQAEDLVQSGIADFVAMGRAIMADPELPKLSTQGKFDQIRLCLGCNDGCAYRTGNGLDTLCAVNPFSGYEYEFDVRTKATRSKKVLVTGAGPAGMEAAWIAAKRGHKVVLCEKSSRVGGQFYLAGVPYAKEDIFIYLANMKRRLQAAGVELRLNCEVNEVLLQKEKPDHVLLATGGEPLHIPFIGLDSMQHLHAHDVLRQSLQSLGKHVAVIGGGLVGAESADFIASTGRKVTVIEMADVIAPETHSAILENMFRRFESMGVTLLTGHKVMRCEKNIIFVQTKGGVEKAVTPVDTVVLAVGVRSTNPLEEVAKKLSLPCTLVGDCLKPGRVLAAIHAAREAAFAI